MSARAPIDGSGEDRIIQANFRVEFDGGGSDVEYAQTVSGITIETRNAQSRQGGTRGPKNNSTDNNFPDVTITFSVTSLINSIQAWAKLAKDGAAPADRKRNVTIIPLKPDLTELNVLCTLVACSPVSYGLGDWDANSQDVLTVTLVVSPEDVRFETNQG